MLHLTNSRKSIHCGLAAPGLGGDQLWRATILAFAYWIREDRCWTLYLRAFVSTFKKVEFMILGKCVTFKSCWGNGLAHLETLDETEAASNKYVRTAAFQTMTRWTNFRVNHLIQKLGIIYIYIYFFMHKIFKICLMLIWLKLINYINRKLTSMDATKYSCFILVKNFEWLCLRFFTFLVHKYFCYVFLNLSYLPSAFPRNNLCRLDSSLGIN